VAKILVGLFVDHIVRLFVDSIIRLIRDPIVRLFVDPIVRLIRELIVRLFIAPIRIWSIVNNFRGRDHFNGLFNDWLFYYNARHVGPVPH
jgi:hypothetical protein